MVPFWQWNSSWRMFGLFFFAGAVVFVNSVFCSVCIVVWCGVARCRGSMINACAHIYSIPSECPFYLLLKMLFSTISFYNFRFRPQLIHLFSCCHSNFFFLRLSIRGHDFFSLVSYLKSSHSTIHWIFPKKAVLEKVIISVMGKFLCI